MAIANNPERKTHDMADLEALFRSIAAGFLPAVFNSVDEVRLKKFTRRFGILEILETLLPLLDINETAGSPNV